MPLQAKLLRFLQSRVIERVGGREEIPVDIRVVCATNKNLQELITQQLFRQDLFYRVGEVTINVPALRERRGGPAVLAHAMLRRFADVHSKSRRGFSDDAVAALEAYSWPGNVRELENKVKSAMIMAEGSLITAADLGLNDAAHMDALFNLKEVRARAERHAIQHTLSITEGNISRTAELLGVSRPTLYDLLEKYGMRAVE
jgi:two-component system NtrC family response regulator